MKELKTQEPQLIILAESALDEFHSVCDPSSTEHWRGTLDRLEVAGDSRAIQDAIAPAFGEIRRIAQELPITNALRAPLDIFIYSVLHDEISIGHASLLDEKAKGSIVTPIGGNRTAVLLPLSRSSIEYPLGQMRFMVQPVAVGISEATPKPNIAYTNDSTRMQWKGSFDPLFWHILHKDGELLSKTPNALVQEAARIVADGFHTNSESFSQSLSVVKSALGNIASICKQHRAPNGLQPYMEMAAMTWILGPVIGNVRHL